MKCRDYLRPAAANKMEMAQWPVSEGRSQWQGVRKAGGSQIWFVVHHFNNQGGSLTGVPDWTETADVSRQRYGLSHRSSVQIKTMMIKKNTMIINVEM